MKLGIKALACGVLALAHFGLAAAGPIEDAEVAFNRGDYVTAMKILRPLAERGDATAEYDVGVMYDQGFGVTQNQTELAKWYHRAADHGLAHAQHNLGSIYLEGQGVAQDYAEAAKWYRKAADQGDADGQAELGLLPHRRNGVNLISHRRRCADGPRWR